jgi:hypothetical protein
MEKAFCEDMIEQFEIDETFGDCSFSVMNLPFNFLEK